MGDVIEPDAPRTLAIHRLCRPIGTLKSCSFHFVTKFESVTFGFSILQIQEGENVQDYFLLPI